MKLKKAWRDTFLVERGKITSKKMKVRDRLEAQHNKLSLTKEHRLEQECEKAEYQPPCKGHQVGNRDPQCHICNAQACWIHAHFRVVLYWQVRRLLIS